MANRGINKVIIVGNVGQDPEVKFLPNGNAVANLNVATSESWKDKATGKMRDKTEWHRIVIFGKLAEIAGEYIKKGSQVYIEGQLQTRKWQDQSGNDKYITEIVVNIGGTLQILGSRSNDNASNSDRKWEQAASNNSSAQARGTVNQKDKNSAPPMDFDDDIPF